MQLFTIRIKSLEHPEGQDSDVCRSCADHARFICESQGPKWYIRGEVFQNLGRAGEGECLRCEYTRRSCERIERGMGR